MPGKYRKAFVFNFNNSEENILYQQLQKICREKICHINIFREIWGKSGKISFAHHKNCLLLQTHGAGYFRSYKRRVELLCFAPVS